jgi:hypothetical protein
VGGLRPYSFVYRCRFAAKPLKQSPRSEHLIASVAAAYVRASLAPYHYFVPFGGKKIEGLCHLFKESQAFKFFSPSNKGRDNRQY